jgi:hypothetical protein
MSTNQTLSPLLHLSPEHLLAFVGSMISGGRGREDDEHPLPPGPWDPVIRAALDHVHVFGPRPEPWRVAHDGRLPQRAWAFSGTRPEAWKIAFASLLARHPEIFDVLGGGHSFGDEAALNPQPLPPRYAVMIAVAQAVVRRSELFQEIAAVVPAGGSAQGGLGGYTRRFSDDWCGNGFRLRWPLPGPRPSWFPQELEGLDLLVLATEFDRAAKDTFSQELRQNLASAAASFLDAGVSRMQSGLG